jgi:hypothetical protein
VPNGVIGVVMATCLGWLLGKAMLETRGFFWAWFITFRARRADLLLHGGGIDSA